MLNNSQIILALTGVAAACLVANGLAEVGLILIIAVAVSLAVLAVVRWRLRVWRAQRALRAQRRRDQAPTFIIVHEVAPSTLNPADHDQLMRNLRMRFVWPLGPDPDSDGGKK